MQQMKKPKTYLLESKVWDILWFAPSLMNVGFVSGRLFRQGRLDYVLLDYVYSSIGRTELSPFLGGGDLIKVGGE